MVEVSKVNLLDKLYINEKTLEPVYDRSNPSVQAVSCHRIPEIAILDQKHNLLDLNVVKRHFFNEGRLSDAQVHKILKDVGKILKKEKNLLEIDKRCYIIGDIHGQFYDLIALLDLIDLNSEHVLFLGDYVDRGAFGVETYLYLLLLKCHYPNNIFLLRGNHESEKMTRYFTFRSECIYKYNLEIYLKFVSSFSTLPIAAVIQKSAFCCHGGISPELSKVADLNKINRFCEINYSGVFCDIFWSDPHPEYDTKTGLGWDFNMPRRCSVFYNYLNVCKFLDSNKLKTIIRGHEVQETGYRVYKEYNGAPSIVTIFSAPKYCDAYNNVGAFIEYDNGIVSIKQFDAVQHPYTINGFLDGINWSLPFMSEKAIDFCIHLFNALHEMEVIAEPETALTKMSVMRAERESIDEFEETESSCCSSILETKDIGKVDFDQAKTKDAVNEMKKDKTEDSNISLDISPSLKTELIKDLGSMNISEAIKNEDLSLVISEADLTEEIKINNPLSKSSKAKPKRNLCKYFCGIF